MPLTRYQSRNEYGLADPDLYQTADKDDPEALLEGVAMAGLVGILRQLGDLAEFAAEMFHDLHEEVMATASRSHGLMARVQQLEVEFPYIEKTLLCQTDHSPFFVNKGEEWHPNVQLEQGVVTRGDLPRCVMDSYEECRGPPRLFLLDKFDISGAGACLKRYTDPSFVKHETSSYEATWDDIQREKKSQKAKRRASHLRNGGTPDNGVASHAKLHELFMEEHLETRNSDPARLVKLKTRKLDGYSLISKSGESYMEKFVQTSVDDNAGHDLYSPNLEVLTWNMDSARDVVTDIPEISMVDTREKSHRGSRTEVSNLNIGFIEKDIETVPESTHKEVSRTTSIKDSQTYMNGKARFLQHRTSEDLTSEADNYVDARATMESETETEDECRPKNRSEALNNGNHYTYSDVDEERMEDPSQFSFFHSVENTPVSENGQNSLGKQSTSFSYSDTASISVDDQSEGEKLSGRLPSTSSFKSEPVDTTPQATPEANNVEEFVSSSSADGQTSFSSNDKCSSPRAVSQNVEPCSLNVHSLAPEVVETPSEFVRIDPIKGGSNGSEVDPISSSRSSGTFDVKNANFHSETSSISSKSEGSRYDSTIEKSCMVDHSSNLVDSNTSPQVFVGIQTGKQLSAADNDVECETNSTNDSSKVLANSSSDTKSCDGSSLTGNVLPCSPGTGMEISPDMPSKVCDPSTADAIHLEETLGDDTGCVAVTNAVADVDSQRALSQGSVADVDSQSSVAEISNEHSCAFDTTADISVAESHEETLENEMSMPAVDSKLTSDLNSRVEISVGDASPNQISDIPVEVHSSSMHEEGIDDLSRVENAATDIVPNLELAVSDSDSETSIADVIHSSTSMGSPLPWISSNRRRLSSEAGEISQDVVVESDVTIQTENNLESEITTQEGPLEVSLEDLGSALDNNDLANCESLSPVTSLDQSDRDTETKSLCKSILDDSCTDSSPVNNLNLLESVTSEQSVVVETPCASHAFEDEEMLLSSASSEFVPQPVAIELNSPEQELNLDPSFPSFGFIPETSPGPDDMPPLPPLPPMQWRVGKASHSFFPSFMGETGEASSSAPTATPPFGSSFNIPAESKPSEVSVSLGSEKIEQLPEEFVNNASERPLESSVGSSFSIPVDSKPSELSVSLGSDKSEQLPEDFVNNASERLLEPPNQFPITGTDSDGQFDGFDSQRTQSADHSTKLAIMPNEEHIENFACEENNLLPDHAAQNHEIDYPQASSSELPEKSAAKYEDFKDDTVVHVSESSGGDNDCPETKALIPTQSTKVEDNGHYVPDTSSAETAEPSSSSVQKISPDASSSAEPSSSSVQKIIPVSVGDAMWPVSAFAVTPTLDINKLKEVPMIKFSQPRSPLVDAVAAHDRRKMKKVSERVQPPIKSNQDDKDSWLAEIRNKSVNLKPAVSTRPKIQTGPKTNLRVAAILEKANTIRQAMAGSDEDEDSDSWSDS